MLKKLIFSGCIVIAIAGIYLFLCNNVFNEKKTLPDGIAIDSCCVWKSKRILKVFSKGKEVKTYDVSLGNQPIGDKEYEGDCKTPEGLYTINDKNPNSHYHRNLGISYPNATDIKAAEAMGKSAGKDIKIHGLGLLRGPIGVEHLSVDWTTGCIAVTNEEIEELYENVPIGTPILILK
jgi:murein L,D-transpeptidase YafK